MDEIKLDNLKFKITGKYKCECTGVSDRRKRYDTITIPSDIEVDGVTYSIVRIGRDSFCFTKVREIIISEGIEEIGTQAFCRCLYLEKLVLPNSLKRLEWFSIVDCFNLKDIDFKCDPDKLQVLCGNFTGTAYLKDLLAFNPIFYFGETVYCSSANKDIIIRPRTKYVYLEGNELTKRYVDNLYLPSSIETILTYNFRVSNLIIEDLESYCQNTFYVGRGLLPPSPKEKIKLWIGDNQITDLEIPNTIESLGNYLFCNTDLKNLYLEDGVKKIGSRCFEYCDFSSIYLPERLITGFRAFFSDCLDKATLVINKIQSASSLIMGNLEKISYLRLVIKDEYVPNIAVNLSNLNNFLQQFRNVKQIEILYCRKKGLDSFLYDLVRYFSSIRGRKPEIILHENCLVPIEDRSRYLGSIDAVRCDKLSISVPHYLMECFMSHSFFGYTQFLNIIGYNSGFYGFEYYEDGDDLIVTNSQGAYSDEIVVIPEALQINNKVKYIRQVEAFAFSGCKNLREVIVMNPRIEVDPLALYDTRAKLVILSGEE